MRAHVPFLKKHRIFVCKRNESHFIQSVHVGCMHRNTISIYLSRKERESRVKVQCNVGKPSILFVYHTLLLFFLVEADQKFCVAEINYIPRAVQPSILGWKKLISNSDQIINAHSKLPALLLQTPIHHLRSKIELIHNPLFEKNSKEFVFPYYVLQVPIFTFSP